KTKQATHRKAAQTLLLCAAVFALLGTGDPATRFNEIGHQMMCICGCNQVLLERNHVGCPASDGMRNELQAAITRGDSDSLVEQSFVQKYGPTVLAAPSIGPSGSGFQQPDTRSAAAAHGPPSQGCSRCPPSPEYPLVERSRSASQESKLENHQRLRRSSAD